jgi:uncharacterized membrane protein
MDESEARFTKARLEAFSDGVTAVVIAIIITIMVLELKAPEDAEPGALMKLWPSFAIYLVSFVFVAIYWINHHNLLSEARRVSSSLIWANTALLFCLSLIPFATAYVAETRLAPFPAFAYGALQFACGGAYVLTFEAIAWDRRGEPSFRAVVNARRMKSLVSMTIYLAATGLALISPLAALALFVVVAAMYVFPPLFARARAR